MPRSSVRSEAVLSKLLNRTVQEAQRQGVTTNATFTDRARAMLEEQCQTGSVSDRDIRNIIRLAAPPASTKVLPPVPSADRSFTPPVVAAKAAVSVEPRSTSSLSSALLLNTSKRQRQMLADREWNDAAERDRIAGAQGRLQEAQARFDLHLQQRTAFDGQLHEHKLQQDASRVARRHAQDAMTKNIQDVQQQIHREKQEAVDKAQREKQFREQQARELDETRERTRVHEHNEEVRHMTMIQQELQRQRDAEAAQKLLEKSEWKRVLKENEDRLREKAMQKARERDEDRRFQREYEENLDKQERERAEVRAKKEARAATFQQLASGVANMHQRKVQNVDDKIQMEFEAQQRRAQQDELERKRRAQTRIEETHRVLDLQRQQKDEIRAVEREAARRTAEAMAEQAREAARQEAARKQAARTEAARMKEFLTTQLQLQHFRETKPLETSITRPESRGKTMFSPSRYTPSPSLQL